MNDAPSVPDNRDLSQEIERGRREGREVTVEVESSTERWTECTLKDGTRIRLRPVIMGITKIEGLFDSSGKPVYSVDSGMMVNVVHAKEGQAP